MLAESPSQMRRAGICCGVRCAEMLLLMMLVMMRTLSMLTVTLKMPKKSC